LRLPATRAQWPQADLTITANPIALDYETIVERVLLIGTRLRLPVHHVVIQDMDGRKSVTLDLEVDSAMNLESRPFDRFGPRGGHRRRGPNTALGTLGRDREFHGPLAVARPTARIYLEATLPSRARRYTRGPIVTAGHTICDFQIHLIRTPSCMLRPTLAQFR
jgi:hypothetical protein